jgi:hypothetical protein
MDIASQRGGAPRRSEEELKAIRRLIAENVPRKVAERLVDEIGTDPEKLKAAAWVEMNLPRAYDAGH